MSNQNKSLYNLYEWEEVGLTPTGFMMYRKRNEVGGYTYVTDEFGGVNITFDSSADNINDILMAHVDSQKLLFKEHYD